MKVAQFTKSLAVALSEEVYRKIKKITDEERISMAEWVRRIIDESLISLGGSEE